MRHDRSRQRGIALVLVVWVFMVLGVLAFDFSRYMREDAMAAVNLADETRGYYLALAGMNRALWEAMRAREEAGQTRPGTEGAAGAAMGAVPGSRGAEDEVAALGAVDGQWHEGQFGGGRFEVRLIDQGGLLPLNKADESLLNRVITAVVLGPNAAVQGKDRRAANDIAVIVDSILDWRDADNLKRVHGAESEYYLALRPPYAAKNGFFDSPEELLLVRGMTPELFYGANGEPGLRDLVSVYNRGGINVRTAPPALLGVLLGKDASAIASLGDERASEQVGFLDRIRAEAAAVDPRMALGFVDEAPHLMQIEARADVSQERNRSTVAAVVDIAGDDLDGAKVLRWLDRAPWSGGLPPAAPAPEGLSS